MAVRSWSPSLALPAVDRRLLMGVLLAAVSAALVLALTRPPETVPVLVAGDSVPAGVPLGDAPISVRQVTDASGLVEGTDVGELSTWVLAIPLGEGEPVIASALRPPETVASPNVLALALPPEHAVGGALAPGSLVDVYATVDATGGESSTVVVASDVFVIDVTVVSDGIASGDVEVLLAVDDDVALAITAARRSGALDLVKVGS